MVRANSKKQTGNGCNQRKKMRVAGANEWISSASCQSHDVVVQHRPDLLDFIFAVAMKAN